MPSIPSYKGMGDYYVISYKVCLLSVESWISLKKTFQVKNLLTSQQLLNIRIILKINIAVFSEFMSDLRKEFAASFRSLAEGKVAAILKIVL